MQVCCCVQGTNEAIFVLAPVLLLLNQDPLLCRGLTPERRYFPPVCATTLYLAANAVTAAIMKHSMSSQRGSSAEADNRIGTWYLIWSLTLVLATLPNLLIFLRVSLPAQNTGEELMFISKHFTR